MLHHSDRGSQDASDAYRQTLGFHGMTASMSRGGNWYDNAPMESFWGTLKQERLHRERFAMREQARSSIFQWIEVWYNRKRSDSWLGYVPGRPRPRSAAPVPVLPLFPRSTGRRPGALVKTA